ncbi:MAG: TraR/DksA family transcriptional regulator [Desulfobacterales bacterium]|jgi:DnaK suppressor protein
MNKTNLKYFKRRLSAQLQDLSSGSDCNLQGLEAPDENRADPIDQAAHVTERNFSHHLCDRSNAGIREIERALQDIEDGLYGICDLCEENIPIKRLKANPMARYCIECQTKMENQQRVEGE